MKATLDAKKIDMLRNLPDMIPAIRDFYENWTIRIFNREEHECRSYLSPNRRDFYQILLITKGAGVFTSGLNTYYLDEPAILFIHPNAIISWKSFTPGVAGGYYVLFKRAFIEKHTLLKSAIEKFGVFTGKNNQVIKLNSAKGSVLESYFERMKQEELAGDTYNEDAIQAYLQLLIVESLRSAQFAVPQIANDEFHHIHEFFNLLEKEASGINYHNPIRLKTAKEFASILNLHPNHLNALLKKHTGENVSTHIRNRILEEAKVLLLQTDWPLKDIGFSIGFADQPNFSQFFKKTTGITPAEFRKNYTSKGIE